MVSRSRELVAGRHQRRIQGLDRQELRVSNRSLEMSVSARPDGASLTMENPDLERTMHGGGRTGQAKARAATTAAMTEAKSDMPICPISDPAASLRLGRH